VDGDGTIGGWGNVIFMDLGPTTAWNSAIFVQGNDHLVNFLEFSHASGCVSTADTYTGAATGDGVLLRIEVAGTPYYVLAAPGWTAT
jgi:hypothetical protein